jgi:cell fate regulator YaaT (PSP1 superfamily)
MSNNVRVVCRFRPQNKNEEEKGGKVIIEVNQEQTSVKLNVRKQLSSKVFNNCISGIREQPRVHL